MKSWKEYYWWCAPIPTSLPVHQPWKPAVPALWLMGLVTYGLADKLHHFVAGVFIPQYHYPYAVALCFSQVMLSLLLLNLLHALNLVSLKKYSRPLGERMLVPAICGGVQAVLAMWAMASTTDTGLFPFTIRLMPLFTAGWSHILKIAVAPSGNITVLIAILSGVSVVIAGSQGVSGMDPLEYLYAPMSLILRSLALTWLSKVAEPERHHSRVGQSSILDLYYTHLVNQSWVLGLLCLLHPDAARRALTEGSWCSLLFNGYLLTVVLLGMVLRYLVDLTALRFSPLAAALLSSVRELTQPFRTLYYFHN